MSYTITIPNHTYSIAPGATDTTTSLTLLGKNVPNYGQIIAQNFVDLLQNFNGYPSGPRNPLTGQLFWNNNLGTLQVWNGTLYKNIGAVTSGNSSPASALVGDLWWDTTLLVLKVYSGNPALGDNGWITIGPSYPVNTGKNGPIIETLEGHVVMVHYIENVVMAITSKDADFTLASPINGKNSIKTGYNQMLGVVNAIATQAEYADLAERYIPDSEVTAGQVVIFGGTAEVSLTSKAGDTRVAGIVSTAPAYLMNSESVGVAIALTGKVPGYVRGPVFKGDRLTTSTEPGVMQVLDMNTYEPGCIVGKAMEDHPDTTIRSINVAVGRF